MIIRCLSLPTPISAVDRRLALDQASTQRDSCHQLRFTFLLPLIKTFISKNTWHWSSMKQSYPGGRFALRSAVVGRHSAVETRNRRTQVTLSHCATLLLGRRARSVVPAQHSPGLTPGLGTWATLQARGLETTRGRCKTCRFPACVLGFKP